MILFAVSIFFASSAFVSMPVVAVKSIGGALLYSLMFCLSVTPVTLKFYKKIPAPGVVLIRFPGSISEDIQPCN